MGRYSENYEAAERATRNTARDNEMKWRRKAVEKLDEAVKYLSYYDMPDRFKWSFQDYRRWLLDGLEEWEKEQTWQTLKKES